MDLTKLMRQRRSVRTYADVPIPEEQLDVILQAGMLAPTSRNRKPCTFHIITDKTMLECLSRAKHSGASFTAQAGAAVIVAADSKKSDTWVEDSAIAMTYMMLAAEAQALGCCWVQIHLRTDAEGGSAEERVRELLGLSENFRIVGFLTLGVKV